mmetsp:Transcript_106568/g.208966  ORF Transcript_106568/g.208966 Transcript_106568/m.208966 type:complete len:239 (+) Transcript_106568:7-723(+)
MHHVFWRKRQRRPTGSLLPPDWHREAIFLRDAFDDDLALAAVGRHDVAAVQIANALDEAGREDAVKARRHNHAVWCPVKLHAAQDGIGHVDVHQAVALGAESSYDVGRRVRVHKVDVTPAHGPQAPAQDAVHPGRVRPVDQHREGREDRPVQRAVDHPRVGVPMGRADPSGASLLHQLEARLVAGGRAAHLPDVVLPRADDARHIRQGREAVGAHRPWPTMPQACRQRLRQPRPLDSP